jgi:nitroreductase
MKVIEAIAARRSVRQFKPTPVPDAVLERLLNAMRIAPSGSNRQPWKFIVVRDPVVKERVTQACSFARSNGEVRVQSWIASAPVVIVACGCIAESGGGYYKDGQLFLSDYAEAQAAVKAGATPREGSLSVNLAIALDHLTLAAMEEGLGTCWIGGLDERLVKKALSIPDGWIAPLAMPIGYPVSWPEAKPRKSLSEIVCYDKFE